MTEEKIRQINEILLLDGWHRVEPDSARAVEYRLADFRGPAGTGYVFKELTDDGASQALVVRSDAILAVRFTPEEKPAPPEEPKPRVLTAWE